MKHIRRTLALLLSLALLTGSVLAAGILPERAHEDMTMEALSALKFSFAEFSELCETILKTADAGDTDGVRTLLEELKEQYLRMDTELAVADLQAAQDVTDEARAARHWTLIRQSYDVEQMMTDTVVAVLDGPCSAAVDQEDEVLGMFLWPTEPLTDEEERLYEEEQQLVDAYYAAGSENFTAEIGGSSYDEDALYWAYYGGEITWQEYDDGLLAISKAQNDALAGYYVALVENRRAQAALYGETDFAALMDEYSYYRDYNRREIEAFQAAVKQEIVPVANEIYDLILDWSDAGAYEMYFSEEELLTHLKRGIEAVSPELTPACDYMLRNGLYDIEWNENKTPGAFTTILPYSAGPFLYMQPDGIDSDFTGIVHEFGHYNAYYCAENLYAYNLDLGEIHSQGLELLMLEEYDEVFGADADAERLYTIYAMLESIMDGCMMDELERWAYGEENLTAEKMNRKYMALLKEYGYRDADDPEEMAYGWVNVMHLYEYPLYYLSYAVSASGAMAIWQTSLEDREGAIDAYLRLVALGEDWDFFQALDQVGLENPLTEAHLHSVAASAAAEAARLSRYGDSAEALAPAPAEETQEDDGEIASVQPEKETVVRGLIIWLIVTAVLDLAAAAAAIVILKKGRRK